MKITDREAQIILTVWGLCKADFETLQMQMISKEEVTDFMCRLLNFRMQCAKRCKEQKETL